MGSRILASMENVSTHTEATSATATMVGLASTAQNFTSPASPALARMEDDAIRLEPMDTSVTVPQVSEARKKEIDGQEKTLNLESSKSKTLRKYVGHKYCVCVSAPHRA